jgi:hypothetical protein
MGTSTSSSSGTMVGSTASTTGSTGGITGGVWINRAPSTWSALASDSTGAQLVATAVAPNGLGDLWTSSDYGATWTEPAAARTIGGLQGVWPSASPPMPPVNMSSPLPAISSTERRGPGLGFGLDLGERGRHLVGNAPARRREPRPGDARTMRAEWDMSANRPPLRERESAVSWRSSPGHLGPGNASNRLATCAAT